MLYHLIRIDNQETGDSISFTRENGYMLSSVTGLTSNSVDVLSSVRVGQPGTVFQGTRVNEKTATFDGTIAGTAPGGKRRLLRLVAPEAPLLIVYNNAWQIRGRVVDFEDIELDTDYPNFQFSIRLNCPYWHKSVQTREVVVGKKKMFRIPFNMSQPTTHRFSRYSDDLLPVIRNGGDVAVEFEVIFRAVSSLSNPSLTKYRTGETIKINAYMNAGDEIRVNFMDPDRQAQVMYKPAGSAAEQDIFSKLTFESEFFLLDVGETVLSYTADINVKGLEIYLSYNEMAFGVVEDMRILTPPLNHGSSSAGVSGFGAGGADYNQLDNRPMINGVEVVGNKSLEQYGLRQLSDAEVQRILDT